ncbi:MAG: DUF6262 family protein [Pseudonocardia sp.]
MTANEAPASKPADARARRMAVLSAAAKARSEAKIAATERALRALVKRGEPITFQSVQREAGVSHAFLYTNPELRGRIEHLRSKARPAAPAAFGPATETTLVQALTAQIAQLKRQHRDRVQALRAALEQAHGENLELRRELDRRGWINPTTHSHDETSSNR